MFEKRSKWKIRTATGLLLLAAACAAQNVGAAMMGIDLEYDGVLFSNIHEAEATLFYDSADVTGAAHELVTLSGFNIRVRATWSGDDWTGWVVFNNNQTAPCTLACGTYANRTPFTATFRNGVFGPVRFAGMAGLQRAPTADYENLILGSDAHDGDIAVVLYGRSVGGRLSDTVAISAISAPYALVPVPAAAWLLASVLPGLLWPGRNDRRSRRR